MYATWSTLKEKQDKQKNKTHQISWEHRENLELLNRFMSLAVLPTKICSSGIYSYLNSTSGDTYGKIVQLSNKKGT